jgi:hypothetical protein
MTWLRSRVGGFKNSNPIPEPITCGFGGFGRIISANERIQINNGWIRTHEHPYMKWVDPLCHAF